MSDPQTKPAAIILGASTWPHYLSLGNRPSCARSAERFLEYVKHPDRLAVPEHNILRLFDSEDNHVEISIKIHEFLQERIASITDLFLYYTGHGQIAYPERKLKVLLRATHKTIPNTAYSMEDLAHCLNQHARNIRKWIILDCCSAGAAQKDFIPLSPEDIPSIVHEEAARLLPRKGTALLCASSAAEFASAPDKGEYTMFSGALLDVLELGDENLGELMSLSEVAKRIEDLIFQTYEQPVRPEFPRPDSREGDLALIPIFPNASAYKIEIPAELRALISNDNPLIREGGWRNLLARWREREPGWRRKAAELIRMESRKEKHLDVKRVIDELLEGLTTQALSSNEMAIDKVMANMHRWNRDIDVVPNHSEGLFRFEISSLLDHPMVAVEPVARLEPEMIQTAESLLQPDHLHEAVHNPGTLFVGREREMQELTLALDDALSGQGHLVMLSGESGIGKTHIAKRLGVLARQRGVLVFWGRCDERRVDKPYGPWSQAIWSYMQSMDVKQLRSEMGAGATNIAEVVPELRDWFPNLTPKSVPELMKSQYQLFDSVATFLQRIGSTKPLLLILENLHWADKDSLLLLEFLARQLDGLQILMLGTYQDTELKRGNILSHILGELTKDRLLHRISLKGLGQAEINDYIELASGIRPPPNLVRAILSLTRGNSFWVAEVVQLLIDRVERLPEGLSIRRILSIDIPESVRHIIWQRLDKLPTPDLCNKILGAASMIGQEFSLDLLEKLIPDMSRDVLEKLAEEALTAKIIEEVSGSRQYYQFRHILVQQVLASEFTRSQRRQWHTRIAINLEELYGSEVDGHATELAYHFAEGLSTESTQKVIYYSHMAGQQMLAVYAYEEALNHFERALAYKEGQPMDDEAALLLFGLSRAQIATLDRNDLQNAVDNLNQAFSYYVKVNRVDQAVVVAEYPFPSWADDLPGVRELIMQALKLVPSNSLSAGYLFSRYGRIVGQEDADYALSQNLLNQALQISLREKNKALEMQVLSSISYVEFFHMRWGESLKASHHAISLSQEVHNPYNELDARLNAARVLYIMGDIEGANKQGLKSIILAKKLHHRYYGMVIK